MTCENPRWIYLPRYMPIRQAEHETNQKKLRKPVWKFHKKYYAIQIPCGECLGCLLDHAKDWATRCACEMETCGVGCFITLTYNNNTRTIKGQEEESSLPINENGLPTLRKKDLKDFWKRLRKHLDKQEIKIRYVACGEYGPKRGRPHYHAVVFGWKPEDLKLYKFNHQNEPLYKSAILQKIWGCGFVTIGELNFQTASYTARYVQKKAGINKKKPKRQREFELKYNMEEVVQIVDEWTKYYDKQEISKETYIQAFMQLNSTNKIIKNAELKEPEFITCSNRPGIGFNYLIEYKDKILRNNGIMVKVKRNVKVFTVPKYLKKKWAEIDYEEYYRWAYQQKLEALRLKEEKIKKMNYPKDWEDWRKEFAYNNHQLKLLKLKAKLLKRINIEKNT